MAIMRMGEIEGDVAIAADESTRLNARDHLIGSYCGVKESAGARAMVPVTL